MTDEQKKDLLEYLKNAIALESRPHQTTKYF